MEQKNLLSCDRRISVIMPTYNGASRGFLAEAIESVLAQTYQNIELCIVDDGSSDETKRLCFDYMTKQRMILYNRSDSALSIKYIYQDNAGVSVARNNGIRNTNGAFVCFLDDDDVWDAKKLEKQLAHIDEVADPCLGLSYTALEIIDAKSNRTGVVQAHRAHGNVFNRLLCQNLVDCTSSVLIPRPIFDDVGMFSPDLSYAEDYDLWLRIAKKYHIYSVEEPSTGGFVSRYFNPLVLYRDHGNKLSANLERIESHTLLVVSRALEQIQGDPYNKNYVFSRWYKNFAAHRFWRGDYDVFRRYVRCLSAYGPIGFTLRMRVVLSYMPWCVRFIRKLKVRFQKHDQTP